jgi:hypothetical protein
MVQSGSLVRNLAVTAVVIAGIGWFVLSAREQSGFVVPPVDGFMEGQRIRFIHTEASDPEVAGLLTRMKGSPVLMVPSLAKAPAEMVATVYVFTNGVPGEGPFKFQPDVFDNPPGRAGYTPLRALALVSWKDPQTARELRSAEEVRRALARGEIAIKQPGVVINMPMITWPPDGHR